MKKKWRSNLNAEEKQAIAEKIKDGKHVKQVAADWQVSPAYVYQIIHELLEWKLEWKMKMAKSGIPVDGFDKAKHTVYASYELANDDERTLAELSLAYPYEVKQS